MTQSLAFPTTLYLVPGALQALSDVSVNPGLPQDGYPLIWNNTTGKWQAEQVAYSNLSGAPALPIPVDSGGTGTQTGSITGTGALTFAAGGTNQNVTLNPSQSGSVVASGFGLSVNPSVSSADTLVDRGLNITLPSQNTVGCGIRMNVQGSTGTFGAINSTGSGFWPVFEGRTDIDWSSLTFVGRQSLNAGNDSKNLAGVIQFRSQTAEPTSGNPLPGSDMAFSFYNRNDPLIRIRASGDSHFISSTESTSTSTGTVRVDGGVGIAKNLNVGGTKINFANLPTNPTGLSVGDLWRDGDDVKVKT